MIEAGKTQPTRRGLLAAAGGVAAASVLAACGDDGNPGRGSRRDEEIATLNSALAFENATIVAYEVGLELASSAAVRRSLREIAADQREHARRLTRAVQRLDGEPAVARGAAEYRRLFPAMRDERDFLTFAADLEDRGVRKYLESLPKLTAPEPRRMAAAFAVEDGRHQALVLALNGRQPAPHAFVTGTT